MSRRSARKEAAAKKVSTDAEDCRYIGWNWMDYENEIPTSLCSKHPRRVLSGGSAEQSVGSSIRNFAFID
jgi:hypothetical protein